MGFPLQAIALANLEDRAKLGDNYYTSSLHWSNMHSASVKMPLRCPEQVSAGLESV